MKEILGNRLEMVMQEYELRAKKTYQIVNENSDFAQVWELSDEDFQKLCDIPDSDWQYDYGWWRSSEGSNMGSVSKRYNINNHYILAWDGVGRESEEENKTLPVDERWITPRKYDNLLEYFCEEIGASTERNVTALATDLARQNGIKISELFKKYQGE